MGRWHITVQQTPTSDDGFGVTRDDAAFLAMATRADGSPARRRWKKRIGIKAVTET